MNTEPQRTCPSCGNEFSGAMKFCPVCMLRKALSDGAQSDGSQDAVQRFEHYELVTAKMENSSNWVEVRWESLTKRSTSIFTVP